MSLVDRMPLDRISTEARDVHFTRSILTIVAAVLFGVGWVARKTLGAIWFACAWSATAVKVGWIEAGRPSGGG